MKKTLITIALCLCLLPACAEEPPKPAKETTPPAKVGADRDAHGCIPSAGYSWCEKTQQCERPWELAKKEGFENSQEGYDTFCGNE